MPHLIIGSWYNHKNLKMFSFHWLVDSIVCRTLKNFDSNIFVSEKAAESIASFSLKLLSKCEQFYQHNQQVSLVWWHFLTTLEHIKKFWTCHKILKLWLYEARQNDGESDWMLTTKGKYERMGQVGNEKNKM